MPSTTLQSKTGTKFSKSKRDFIVKGIKYGLGGLATAATIGGGAAQLYETMVRNRRHDREDKEKKEQDEKKKALEDEQHSEDESRSRFAVRTRFAEHIASTSYAASDLLAGYDGRASLNEGESAITKSFEYFKNSDFASLRNNLQDLETALKWTPETDYDAMAIILSRLMVGTSALGEGELSRTFLNKIPLEKIKDTHTCARLLDVRTIVSLNSIKPFEFLNFSSASLTGLHEDWQKLGYFESTSALKLYQEYGVESVGVLQQSWFVRSREVTAPSTGSARQQLRSIRENYIGQLTERTLSLLTERSVALPDRAALAQNYSYSLHRPAFHAAAHHDHWHLQKIMNQYFSWSPDAVSNELIKNAREKIWASFPGSSPWMLLLDLRHDKDGKRAEDHFRHLRALIPLRGAPSSQMKRAMVRLAKGLAWAERVLKTR